MIEFATLVLSLVVGPQRIDLSVAPSVAAVEIRLDGEHYTTLLGPPWSFVCDFGPRLRPHELVVIARDGDGGELGRARQRINLPRPRAEARLLLRDDGARGRPSARLVWSAPEFGRPLAVEATFDGEPLEVTDLERIELPRHDPKKLHFLRVELTFPESVRASAELVLGGSYAAEVSAALTPYPVLWKGGKRLPKAEAMEGWLARRGEPLPVVAVERRPAELFFVRERGEECLESLRSMLQVRGRMVLPTAIPEALEPGDRVRFVFPSEVSEAEAAGLQLILMSNDVAGFGGGSLFHILTAAFFEGQDDPVPRQRLADAVAIAGLTAAGSSRPRAVVLIRSGETEDASEFDVEQVRSYLRSLGVPLFVWTVWRGSDEASPSVWPGDRETKKLSTLLHAIEELRRHLDRQVVVWLGGSHPPQEIELTARAEGMEGLGSGAPAPDRPRIARELPARARPAEGGAAAESADAEMADVKAPPEVREGGEEAPGEVLGEAASWSLAGQEEIRIERGSVLRREPRASAEALATLPALATLALESRGSWIRLRFGEREGWVDLAAAPEPPPSSGLEVSELGAQKRETLAEALETLPRSEPFGPFTLYTDTSRPSLLERLRPLAESLPGVYAERYGLTGEPPADAVLLFGERESYRAFREAREVDIRFDAAGHAEIGFVALSAGRRSRQEVATTLAHELTHLLNWQRLGTGLPIWLDEGLADDMVLSKIDRKGRLLPDPGLDWRNLRFGREVGAVLNEIALAIDRGAAPALPELLAMDEDSFFADRQLHYALSSLWVRYLLSDTRRGSAEAFRTYLRAAAAGAGFEAEALRRHLGEEWPRLEGGFRRWLGRLITRLGVPVERVE